MKPINTLFHNIKSRYYSSKSIEWKLDWLINKTRKGQYKTYKEQNEKRYPKDLFFDQLYYYKEPFDEQYNLAIHEFEQLIVKLFQDEILEEHIQWSSYALTIKGKAFIGYRKTKTRETVKSYINFAQIALAIFLSVFVLVHTSIEIWEKSQSHIEDYHKQVEILLQKIDATLLKIESGD